MGGWVKWHSWYENWKKHSLKYTNCVPLSLICIEISFAKRFHQIAYAIHISYHIGMVSYYIGTIHCNRKCNSLSNCILGKKIIGIPNFMPESCNFVVCIIYSPQRVLLNNWIKIIIFDRFYFTYNATCVVWLGASSAKFWWWSFAAQWLFIFSFPQEGLDLAESKEQRYVPAWSCL